MCQHLGDLHWTTPETRQYFPLRKDCTFPDTVETEEGNGTVLHEKENMRVIPKCLMDHTYSVWQHRGDLRTLEGDIFLNI